MLEPRAGAKFGFWILKVRIRPKNARLRTTGYPHVGCRLFCRTKPFWISSGSDSPLKFFRSLPGSLRSFIYVFNNPKSMFLSWALIYNPNFDFLQPFEAYKELLAGGES